MKTISAQHSSIKDKNIVTKKPSWHGNILNTVNQEELIETLVLKLTPREKDYFEVLRILIKSDVRSMSAENKIAHALSIFTRFDTTFSRILEKKVFQMLSCFKEILEDKVCTYCFKGLGLAILGNFSSDQMVIELIKITQKRLKTMEDLKQNTGRPRSDMDGQNWRGLKWIAFGSI